MTESTEHALAPGHLPGCLALSKSANWNQNEADWRLMLETGQGWGITLADGALVASTLVLPYGKNFAWVSMVLVIPAHRRNGYASKLLRVALADLKDRGLTPILDATPAGQGVYRQAGFRDAWSFSRLALKTPFSGTGKAQAAVREIAPADWKEILELDARAFGAGREKILCNLAQRLPQAALIAERAGRVAGYLLGRDGREARQLGPLVANDLETAQALLQTALGRVPQPLYADVADHAAALRPWLESGGFEFQRPFTRMVHGADRAPGQESAVFLVAGPELG